MNTKRGWQTAVQSTLPLYFDKNWVEMWKIYSVSDTSFIMKITHKKCKLPNFVKITKINSDVFLLYRSSTAIQMPSVKLFTCYYKIHITIRKKCWAKRWNIEATYNRSKMYCVLLFVFQRRKKTFYFILCRQWGCYQTV